MYRLEMVGFDARELWLDIASQWDTQARHIFLLRQDVLKPLSADSYVWYSVFDEKNTPRIWKDKSLQPIYLSDEWRITFLENRHLSASEIYRPHGVWTNLDAMIDYLNKNWQDNWKPCAIIAVQEVFPLDSEVDKDDFKPPIEPNQVQSDWILLGYDVADYDLFSGLADGGLQDELRAKIKPEWVDNLNDYHLFTNPQAAFDYVEFANTRIPTHMPFYVYAVYLVQLVRASLPQK